METLRALIALLQAINRVGARRVALRIENLNHEDVPDLLRDIMLADRFAWRNAWRDVARAWLLIHVSRWVTRMGGYGRPDNANTILTGLVNRLSTVYESTVRQWITADMSPQATLTAIVVLQTSHSRTAWNPARFTDPMNHNPFSFRYVIHAMRPTAGLGVPSRDQQARFDYLDEKYRALNVITKKEDKNWVLRSAELLLREPWRLRSELLSCSVIDQDHTRTYGNFSFGFVLCVPSQNICLAASTDQAISNAQARDDMLRLQQTQVDRMVQVEEFLESLHGLYAQPLLSPETILARSTGGHNEVIVIGTTGSTSVSVSAIFIKVTARGMVWKAFVAIDEEFGLFALITACSRANNIQIIPIPDDSSEGSDISFAAWLKGATDPKTKKGTYAILPGTETSHKGTYAMLPEKREERRREPQLTLGRNIARMEGFIEGHDRTRDYDLVAIRNEAQRLIRIGYSPANVHRQLHDVDGLPHQVIEHAMNQLGFRNYI